MSPVLVPLTYGKVIGRMLASVGVLQAGASVFPDPVPLAGTVTFTPALPRVTAPLATPNPSSIVPVTVVTTLDSQGYITFQSVRGVSLLATNDPNLNVQGWTYRVSFTLTLNGVIAKYRAFNISVPALTVGNEVDLAFVTPLAWSGGTPVIKGDKGDPGKGFLLLESNGIVPADTPQGTIIVRKTI